MQFSNANDLKDEPYITVGGGQRFYPSRPTFDINVIASALSKQCRFGGHIMRHYSVAEHSVLVRNIMQYFDLGNPFEGLMHDAQEAYLPDMPTPWKVQLPDYKRLERSIEIPLREWAGLPVDLSLGCKLADHVALYIEAIKLVEGGLTSLWSCEDWDKTVKAKADEYLSKNPHRKFGWNMNYAQNLFLEHYYRGKEVVSL